MDVLSFSIELAALERLPCTMMPLNVAISKGFAQ